MLYENLKYNILPEDFKVYVGPDNSVVNWPMDGYEERSLPTVNNYTGPDGGYIAYYSRNEEGGVYSVGDGIYVMGQIRLRGQYINRIFHPYGYENKDISTVQEFKDLCNQTFPVCKGGCWAGGDTGGWFGLQPDPIDPRDKAIDIPISSSLPATVDLREWCSPVKYQGNINSCTAHSAVALVEYFVKRSFGQDIEAARLFLYKVARNLIPNKEGNYEINKTSDSGAYSRTTMKALAMIGVPEEKFWPYDETKVNEEPPAFCYALASSYRATEYYRVDKRGIPKDDVLQQVKTVLAANRPLMFSVKYYLNCWKEVDSTGKISFPATSDSGTFVGLHSIAAVGYDDNIKIKNKDGIESTGAFLIKNSAGTEWGDRGYGWLPYDYLLKGQSIDWWTIMNQDWLDTDQFDPSKKA